MRPLIFFILILFTLQEGLSQKKYLLRLTDCLGINDYQEQVYAIKKPLQYKNLPSEVMDAFIENSFPDRKAFLQIQERQIVARDDSSFITLNYVSSGAFQIKGLVDNRFLVIKAVLHWTDPSGNTFQTSSFSDSSRIFKPENQFRKILDFDCQLYSSLDGVYKTLGDN
jgi:hypothetical protein